MRRKKKIQLLLAILIVIAIIIGVYILFQKNNEDTQKLADLYNEPNASQTYLFEMKKSDDDKTIMAKKSDKTIIDVYSKDSHTTTIVKDNNTYLVLHDREEYYIYQQNNVQQTILTDGLSEVINKDFSIGTEKVKGKKYCYEEFPGSTMFMQASSLDTNEEEIKTRFYFDKDDNLVYIRTIKGVNQELLEISIQKDVDDSMFEIPSNYAEN